MLKDSRLVKRFVLSLFMVMLGAIPCLAIDAGLGNLNLPGYDTVKKINLYLIQRALGDVSDKPFDNMLGIDQGTVTTLGIAFRLTDWADLTIMRSNLNQEFFISNKIRFFDGFSFLWGVANKTSPLITADKTNFVAQIILSEEILRDKLIVTFVPTYSNFYLSNPTFAIGMGGSLVAAEKIGYFDSIEVLGEFTPAFGGYGMTNPELGFGIRLKTPSQVISLMITSVVYAFPNGYVVGNNDGIFHLGFNLSTEI